MSTIRPGVNAEGFAGYQHGSLTNDGATRFIHHLSSDLVAMIRVPVQFFGDGGIDLNLHRAICADCDLILHHQLRWIAGERLPPWGRGKASPLCPTWIPIVIVAEPPVAGPIHPVPGTRRVPIGTVIAAHDLVFHRGIDHGRPEVVLGDNFRSDFLSKGNRLGGRIHFHFELGFLVFLHSEIRVAAELVAVDLDCVIPQRRTLCQGEDVINAAKTVRFQFLLDHFLSTGITY